jgi:hypothetical protein
MNMAKSLLHRPGRRQPLAEAVEVSALAAKIAAMSRADVAVILSQFDRPTRGKFVAGLLAAGADERKLVEALRDLDALDHLRRRIRRRTALVILGLVSGTVSAFHGYRRTGRVASAIGWFVAGTLVPPVTLAIAAAQGFAKPKS